jgi:hypothetical protein
VHWWLLVHSNPYLVGWLVRFGWIWLDWTSPNLNTIFVIKSMKHTKMIRA